jgi:hypothetical protein
MCKLTDRLSATSRLLLLGSLSTICSVYSKARWNSLTDMRLTLKKEHDEMRAYGWIKCACILHNLYINTWRDATKPAVVEELVEKAAKLKKKARRVAAEWGV